MTLIYPEAGEGSTDMMLSEAHQNFARASTALNTLVADLEQQNTDNAGESLRLIKELKAALTPALMERERLEKERLAKSGIANGFAIDFDAAKHEIGRRLACLRAASGEGELSE